MRIAPTACAPAARGSQRHKAAKSTARTAHAGVCLRPDMIPPAFSYLGEGTLLHVPFVLWILLLCAVVIHALLEHTRLGRYAFSIGSNPEAAYYAGVPVRFHTTAVYAIAGLLTGLAGMTEASRLMTGQPTGGQGYELTAIAAVVIGGGSLRGGEASGRGTLVAPLII